MTGGRTCTYPFVGVLGLGLGRVLIELVLSASHDQPIYRHQHRAHQRKADERQKSKECDRQNVHDMILIARWAQPSQGKANTILCMCQSHKLVNYCVAEIQKQLSQHQCQHLPKTDLTTSEFSRHQMKLLVHKVVRVTRSCNTAHRKKHDRMLSDANSRSSSTFRKRHADAMRRCDNVEHTHFSKYTLSYLSTLPTACIHG